MSVAAQLGLDDPARGLLAQARTAWAVWRRHDPRLAVVDDLLDLPGWIRSADRDDVDDVLHELARLGSPTGGDDVVAAGALAWVLLPGASLVAHRLRDMTPRIDECVAALSVDRGAQLRLGATPEGGGQHRHEPAPRCAARPRRP